MLVEKIRNYASLVRFSHTIFALPFAFASLVLAWPNHPITLRTVFWILIAMIGARTAAMGFNRLADRKFDALNPRTAGWELPKGTVKTWEAGFLTIVASLLFVFAAYQLNWTCFVLSPVALTVLFFYSLTKRFTWTSHVFLGVALSLAPIGAWLAVTDAPLAVKELLIPGCLGVAVVFWLAGFDIIYSLQDREFDRAHGLYSIPARFGVLWALRLSSFFHVCTVVFLILVGIAAELGSIYWIGCLAISFILIWEHRIVRPHDLSRINRAFFDFNAYVSIGYLLSIILDLAIP